MVGRDAFRNTSGHLTLSENQILKTKSGVRSRLKLFIFGLQLQFAGRQRQLAG